MSRPILVEFSGLPNSGKTTLLNNLKHLCDQHGINALFIQEAAEKYPKDIIPKGSIEQNIWIRLEEIQSFIEATSIAQNSQKDFIFFDRGYYNCLFWINLFQQKDPNLSSAFIDFATLLGTSYHLEPDFLYVIDVSIEESINRRSKLGGAITFSKEDFLLNYKKNFENFYTSIDGKVLYQDTTGLSKKDVSNLVFNKLLSLL